MSAVMLPGNAHRCDICAAVVMDADKKAHADFHKRSTDASLRVGRQIAMARRG